MFISTLLAVGLIVAPVSASERHFYLTCEDYDWIVEGLDKNEIVSEVERMEIRYQLIEATDPACFEDQDANVDEGTGTANPTGVNTMNALALIKKQIEKASALHDAQIHVAKYRGIECQPQEANGETHGTFCYRGRTYIK